MALHGAGVCVWISGGQELFEGLSDDVRFTHSVAYGTLSQAALEIVWETHPDLW